MAAQNKVVNGTDLLLSVGGKPIAHSTSHSLEMSTNMRDITSKDTGGWTEKSPGRKEWSAQADALTNYGVDASTRTGFIDLFEIWRTGARVQIVSEGEFTYTGEAYISSLSKTAPDAENTTYSVTFEGASELVQLDQTQA